MKKKTVDGHHERKLGEENSVNKTVWRKLGKKLNWRKLDEEN